MILEIFHCGGFARRIRQTRFNQLAEYPIIYAAESDIVKHAVKYQVGSIDGDVCDIGQKPLSIHTLLLTLTAFITEQVKTRMSALFLPFNPLFALIYKTVYLIV
ncbi:MAG: hypothetical protein ACLR5I_14480 [Odoribacter splanchnicus]|uniref:Uncharacterized protein n=1 Tax=Odoribacter splanchnicus TaxID=28118 RepID=A0AAW6FPZ7_9BACT|nr:hypothetical protein [Odoribacter splanchnicus]MDB9209348.1 hypothetical protein [Odoribacter splanchnicus]MDB9216876.1 hypothetical protein [Odoribacter splanchnicus]MDB9225083.1 hypothetical protein [Odoribacter splanchnicus]